MLHQALTTKTAKLFASLSSTLPLFLHFCVRDVFLFLLSLPVISRGFVKRIGDHHRDRWLRAHPPYFGLCKPEIMKFLCLGSAEPEIRHKFEFPLYLGSAEPEIRIS
ncbi:hypothetical protein PIB30_045171 [Stylosanthes scabra]|uniref:Uncharacterized protein n=1 Tax=Stylosanthes scabra TaxID=79078 RepID=A0ABU6XHC1_9FABA|nr:hypothetical protein [Stylosanthes scabra]